MKLVTAIIKPFKLDDVRAALTEIGVPHMSVTEIQGYGRQKSHAALYRGPEYDIKFQLKLKIELAVRDELVDKAIEAIIQAAHTGQVGDGKIFVSPLEQAIRIRTGETGTDAVR
ncbi:MAG: P-II family nitrogen regulator [Nevskia sp.]|nr:P-II family nitrogen regulator [Nevskia sp.]